MGHIFRYVKQLLDIRIYDSRKTGKSKVKNKVYKSHNKEFRKLKITEKLLSK